MKARTSGSGRNGCQAIQYGDQMQCGRCGLSYDVNDEDPPECKQPAAGRQRGREVLDKLRDSLQR